MSLVLTSASFNACLQGGTVCSINDDTSDSNVDLVIVTFKCFGTPASTVMNGRLMSVCKEREGRRAGRKEGGKEGGREGGREGRREGGREGEKEGGKCVANNCLVYLN